MNRWARNSVPIGAVSVLWGLLLLLTLHGTPHAQGSQVGTLRIGWFPVPNTFPLFVALEKGYFEKEHLGLKLVQVPAGPQVVESALADATDGGLVGVVPLTFAALRNLPIKTVITLGTGPAGARLAGIVVRKDSEIRAVPDLKGKTLALASRGTIQHILTVKLLSSVGLSINDIRIVEIPFGYHQAALENNQIDASYQYEPQLTPMGLKGGRVLVYEDEIFPNLEYGGWFFTDRVIAGKKREVQAFVNAMSRAMEFIRTSPREAKEILAKHLKIDPAIAQNMGVPVFDPSGRIDVQNMKEMVASMLALKILPREVKIEEMVNTDFLPKAR